MLELLAGITTIEQVKKDFEKYRPKGRGRPKKIEGVQIPENFGGVQLLEHLGSVQILDKI